ncbi:Serine/threonine protein kinase [Roseibium denhamense]|uniref:Serine/threonine protein kinase n=1 Tax=Roseibium denhamense TaxID=76305 RepID=A0ABY1NW10_9HYPH|nr:Serine/threonine protein kinase [Roseibium denhamense]
METGRIPNDLAQIIRTQLPQGSHAVPDNEPPVKATPQGDADDLDEPTIPHAVVREEAPQNPGPNQSPYLPPLPYLTSPPAHAGDEMRERVDDVVLGSLVEGYKDFRKARESGEQNTPAEEDTGNLDQFLTGYKSARMRSDARRAASGHSRGAASLESLETGHRARADVGSILRDRFVLDEEIGRGAMGIVYSAVDRRRLEAGHDEPYVAIKLLNDTVRADVDALRQMEAEARKSQMLAHPNIANVYDFDRDRGEVFIVMELLQGTTLDRRLSAMVGRPLPGSEASTLLQGMCAALVYAHSKNVVHSDLKPGNVFAHKGAAKLLDFGLAAVTSGDASGSGLPSGLTPSYASPEMFENAPRDPRDDVFALGCIAYQVLSGRHPFGMMPIDDAVKNGARPDPLGDLEPGVWETIEAALAFQREARLPNAEAFQTGLFARSV